MPRQFQFSLGRVLATTALAAMAAWLWSLRDEPGELGDLAFFASPFLAGSAIGQLFGSPFFGALAVVISLLLALNLIQAIGDADSESLMRYAIIIGAIIAWPATLAIIRRWNARHDT